MKRILCLVLALLLAGCSMGGEKAPELTGSLEVRFLDIGAQVSCNGETMLIATVARAEYLQNETADILVMTRMADTQPQGFESIYTPESSLPETLWLNCAGVQFFPVGEELGLRIRFGEETFLFLGGMSAQSQKILMEQHHGDWTADVLSVSGGMIPGQELLDAVQPGFVMVGGRTLAEWPEGMEVFETGAFGPVRAVTEGSGLELSWGLHIQDEAAG